MNIELLDSRRLTGPNLFWDWPGAVLDISLSDIPADLVISAWAEEVTRLMDAMGWCTDNICSRLYEGGASLVINAPIDVLYAACELNEEAFNRAVGWLTDKPLPDLSDTISRLSKQLAKESDPDLLALQEAATRENVPFLWDDDEVSVGFGKTAIVWPADRLPAPETINWQEVTSIPLGIVTGTNGKPEKYLLFKLFEPFADCFYALQMGFADHQHPVASNQQAFHNGQTCIKVIRRYVVGRREHNLAIIFLVNLGDIL